MPETVFVYGTLRRGDCRHGVRSFLRSLAEEAYLDDFVMLNLGGFPGIIPGEGRIRGEVHEYESLAVLDRIEGYQDDAPEEGLYNRVQVEAQLPNRETILCWVYVFNCSRYAAREMAEEIESGDWFEHRGRHQQFGA